MPKWVEWEKNTTRIEIDTIRPYWHRKIQQATGFENRTEASESLHMPIQINPITIAPHTEMFNRMQAGERIAAFLEVLRRIHQIHLTKNN